MCDPKINEPNNKEILNNNFVFLKEDIETGIKHKQPLKIQLNQNQPVAKKSSPSDYYWV
jgi:hypothetical protein